MIEIWIMYQIHYNWNKRETAHIGNNGFFSCMNTQVNAEVDITMVFTWVRMRKKKHFISNTANFFCFKSNVSNLYNNDAIIYKK
jgi:hypothetical protein